VEQLRRDIGDERAARYIRHRDRVKSRWPPPR
jgi:hypothetical protein